MIITVWDYRISLQTVLDQSELYAAKVALHLSNELALKAQDNLSELLSDSGSLQVHDHDIELILKDFEVRNIKIFKPDGEITYSLIPEVIGVKIKGNESLKYALLGKQSSHVATPAYHARIYGSGSTFPMLETYVPMRDPTSGNIIGAIEIYQDSVL